MQIFSYPSILTYLLGAQKNRLIETNFAISLLVFGKNKVYFMPFLLFLKKQQNLKLLSAANYRWLFMG